MTAIASLTTPVVAGRWHVDPVHSTVEFRVRHAGLARVRGVFREFDGTVEIAPDGTLSGGGVVVTASLDTRVEARDTHLRSADFFDVENHPRMYLATAAVETADDGRLSVTADLTIRGTTRPVVLRGALLGAGRDDEGAHRVALELDGVIDRRDFGLTWNAAIDGGGVLVGNRVDMHLELSAVRAS